MSQLIFNQLFGLPFFFISDMLGSTVSYMLTYKTIKNVRIIRYSCADFAGCKPSYGSIYDVN